MSVIIILILASLTVALLFLTGFIWAVRNGQYEDTLTPSMRVLADETTEKICETKSKLK
ncbi:MAG: cbb3-type cytochrome oxidase assembly protein CcoS [Verrucomicrobiales bacterium]|nr:cbb3-type cytochrome oxidase assembly protein CcoS [Verrucomicrobiales bacterium]